MPHPDMRLRRASNGGAMARPHRRESVKDAWYGPSGFGLAIAGAIIYDPGHQTGNGVIVNVPMSFDFSKRLRVNLNLGAQYNDGDPRGLFATGGAGVS